jgi:hypothetical protein
MQRQQAVTGATLLLLGAVCRPAQVHATEVEGGQSTAQTPPDDVAQKTARAADLYDEAKRHYAQADFVAAARSFLAADDLVPSSEALSSAIASARRAQDHLLVVLAAERAIARGQQDVQLAARARVALVEAETYLARLQVRCAPQPCKVLLNGQPVAAERSHLLPGSYELTAHSTRDAASTPQTVHKAFSAQAGVEYNYVLDVTQPRTPPASAQQPAPGEESQQDRPATSAKPLPAWAFYSGLAVTGVLSGLTIWSGVSTLNAKHDLPSTDSANFATARDDVYDQARRTDWLLAGTVVMAASTAAVGLWGVQWGDERAVQLAGTLRRGGAELRVRGHF